MHIDELIIEIAHLEFCTCLRFNMDKSVVVN